MMRARWLVLLVPWAIPAVLLVLQTAPAGPGVIDVSGPWEWTAATREQGGPPPSDANWLPLTLPGTYARQGVTDRDLWVRRRFDWAPSTSDPVHVLTLGNLHASVARVYVNGSLVGELGAFARLDRADFAGLELVQLETQALKPGRNEVHVRVRAAVLSLVGLGDQRLLLGPATVLVPWHLRTSRLESFLRTAPPLALGLMALLLASLLRSAADARERAVIRCSLGLVGFGGAYLVVQTGFGLTSWVPLEVRVALLPLCILGTATMLCELLSALLLDQPPRIYRANRVVAPVLAVMGLADVLALHIGGSYLLTIPWMFLLAVTGAGLALQALRQRASWSTLVLTNMALAFGLTGVFDLFTDLGVWHAPKLFALSMVNAPLLACVVVLGRFIALADKNRRLSQELLHSTQDLAGALVEARAATRAKREFLANMSHELKTPLNSLINIPEGLLEDFEGEGAASITYVGNPERSRHYLQVVHKAGVHLLGVVSQVIDFSTLNAGRMAIHLERVPVDELLTEVLGTLEGLATKRRQSLRATGALDGALDVDRVKVAQVLLNLGNNALKFSPEGTTVEFNVIQGAASVEFRVIDSGIGISGEHQRLIFEGFRQAEGGLARPFGGAGLGLTLSRKLTELHGGSLSVESQPGQGSTFTARFPRVARPGVSAPLPREQPTGGAPP
jgi:signal transduction histidine kinase